MPRMSCKTSVAMVLATVCVLSAAGRADEVRPRMITSQRDLGGQVSRGVTGLQVVLDFARMVSFDQPARTIIIGNPGVVDGTLSDEYTLVLTGKSVGTTNIIVLGGDGREIMSTAVSVVGNSRQQTTVHLGTAQQVYSCTGPCRPLPVPATSAVSR